MTLCHSCFKPLAEGRKGLFCPKCSRALFGLSSFNGILDFDAPELRSGDGEHSRISISGAQVKFSVKVAEKKIELVQRGGTHILKPTVDASYVDYLDIPANEHVTMQMARQIFRIDTAESALLYFKSGAPVYITKRFDVLSDGFHCKQEDFAQIANLTAEVHGSNYKYSAISYEGIAELINEYVSAGIVALEKFFKLLLFNYLVCNGDAHCKNFSLYKLSAAGNDELTPAYDLMNTSLHVTNELSRTALDFFKDESEFQTDFYAANGFYGTPDFMEFAKRIGIKETRAQKFIKVALASIPAMEQMLDSCFLSDRNKQRYKDCIRDREKALSI